MAFMGSLFSGAPDAQQANILNPATVAQATTAYDQTQQALQQQQAFSQALAAQNGIQNQSQVYNQLAGIANGTGPNPAQAALNQATSANVANQASLMAGQRGSSANAGLIARQAAQQGANIQQQAVGQGATMQAQQQQAAINAMAGVAGQQVGQQAQSIGAQNQYALGGQQNILGAIANQNNANVSATNAANAFASGNYQNDLGFASNLAGSVSGGLSKGAQVASTTTPQNKAHGGVIDGPKSKIGQHFHGIRMSIGGKVPVILSPGEGYLDPSKAEAVAKGKADPIKESKIVPGKAKVKGDSLKNDTVHTDAEEGAIVIPRSVMMSKNPAAEAARFVQAHLKQQSKKSK